MSIPIIDTHQHLIYPDKLTYSWTKGIPQLEGYGFSYEEYLREIEGTGITATVFVETAADSWREEAAMVYELVAQPRSLMAGVVANCRPEEDGFEEYVDSKRHPKLVGLRRICHVESDDFSRQTRFVENVRRIGKLGLTFDLCFLARQLPIALELAGKCPNVQFILDHCGIPDIAAGTLDPWRDHISKLAALPNVACKISGLPAYCRPEKATIEAVRPYIEHSLESFGWNRVVWGSDWPVCNLTTRLGRWVAMTREIIRHAGEADQRKFFYGNARHIYKLQENAELISPALA